LPFKISRLAGLYAAKYHLSAQDAIRQIYRSKTYQRLENERTKLWHYGPVALLEELEDELHPSQSVKA
jgi:hypothetical protein